MHRPQQKEGKQEKETKDEEKKELEMEEKERQEENGRTGIRRGGKRSDGRVGGIRTRKSRYREQTAYLLNSVLRALVINCITCTGSIKKNIY